MKRTFIFTIISLLTLTFSTESMAQKVNKSAKKAHKGWKLVWADEFDADKLDTTSWVRCNCDSYVSDWNRHMSSLDSLVTLKDGLLTLHAINTPQEYYDPKNRSHLTGGVDSHGMRSIHLGRVDVRARFDCAKGFWPAIWLLPDNGKSYLHGGEIDIMEHLNHEKIAYQTLHNEFTINKIDPSIKSSDSQTINPSEFNIYSVIINQDSVEFLINGKPTFTYSRINTSHKYQFPYADNPYYVILSAQLGGTWVGSIESKELPAKMEIDYVRFYQKK